MELLSILIRLIWYGRPAASVVRQPIVLDSKEFHLMIVDCHTAIYTFLFTFVNFSVSFFFPLPVILFCSTAHNERFVESEGGSLYLFQIARSAVNVAHLWWRPFQWWRLDMRTFGSSTDMHTHTCALRISLVSVVIYLFIISRIQIGPAKVFDLPFWGRPVARCHASLNCILC